MTILQAPSRAAAEAVSTPVLGFLWCLVLASALAAPPPSRVIILSRHGVRRQFPSSAFDFSKFAPGKKFDTEDIDWGASDVCRGPSCAAQAVGAGNLDVLTQHGYAAVMEMGKAQRQRYGELVMGHVPSKPDAHGHSQSTATSTAQSWPCVGKVSVYVEKGMVRDEKTAEAFLLGLGCAAPPTPRGAPPLQGAAPGHDFRGLFVYDDADYIIDQGSHPRGAHGECKLLTAEETRGRVGGDMAQRFQHLAPYHDQLDQLSELLGCCDPSLCDRKAGEDCSLADLPTTWSPDRWYTTFEGPLYAAKYFSEWIFLTLLNGMDFAWGKLSVEEATKLSSFVTLYRSFEFDLPAAQAFGSTLVSHLAATMQQFQAVDQSPYSTSAVTAAAAAAAKATADSTNSADSTVATTTATPATDGWAGDGSAEQGKEEETPCPTSLRPKVFHDADTKVVYYAAHDTNLLYVAELLGLKWLSKGGYQPNVSQMVLPTTTDETDRF